MTYPLIRSASLNMKFTSPRSEIRKHNSDIHRSGESASAKTSNRFWRDFGQVDGSYHSCLADAETSDKSPGVDLAKSSPICKEYDDTENPEGAQLSSSPETSNTIAEDESPSMRLAYGSWESCANIKLTKQHHRQNRFEPWQKCYP